MAEIERTAGNQAPTGLGDVGGVQDPAAAQLLGQLQQSVQQLASQVAALPTAEGQAVVAAQKDSRAVARFQELSDDFTLTQRQLKQMFAFWPPTRTAKVTGLQDDYLECKWFDEPSGTAGVGVLVAKPFEKRGDSSYAVDDILIAVLARSPITVGGVLIIWQDVGASGGGGIHKADIKANLPALTSSDADDGSFGWTHDDKEGYHWNAATLAWVSYTVLE